MHGASGVRGSVVVLGARVAEVDGVGVDDRALAVSGVVVHDGGAEQTLASCFHGLHVHLLGAGAGDGSKRLADKEILLLPELHQLVSGLCLVDGRLLLDQLVLEPGVVGGESSAVTDVAGPHALQFNLVLDRLGIGNRALDLLDLLFAANSRLHSPRSGVGDQVLAVSSLLHISEKAAVGLDLDVVGREMLADGLVSLGLLDVEDGLVVCDGGVAVEDRVVLDIVTAQVEEPRNFVESSDIHANRLLLGNLLAELDELVLDGLASILVRVDKGFVGRRGGTVAAPDLVDQVLFDGDQSGATSLLDGLRELLRDRGSDECRVHAGRLAVLALLGYPVLPGDLLGDTELDQPPVVIQLRCGLVEVSAVGRECGRVFANDGGSSRSVEAREVFSTVEAVRGVFGGVAVAGGNDYQGQPESSRFVSGMDLL